MVSIILSLIFLSTLSSISAECGPWIPLDVDTLPVPDDNDTIIIYNLVSALLECSLGGILADLNAYHGGIGFINTKNNFSVSVNFDAYPTFEGAVLPAINYGPDGNPELIWSATGKVFVYSGINMTYWSFGSEKIGVMSGSAYKQYMTWIVAYNNSEDNRQYYDPISVYTHYPMNSWDKQWVSPHECFSFCAESYRFMAQRGAQFSANSTKESIVAIYTPTAPILMSMEDPAQRKLVTTFYLYLVDRLAKDDFYIIFDILSELMKNDRFYLHHGGKYYMLQPWAPYIEAFYVEVPLPVNSN